MQQLQILPNSVFLQPEFATTAVPIALGAGGLLSLQNGGAGTNLALLTFNAAHGYTATARQNGTTLIQNPTTGHGPTLYGGSNAISQWTLFQITGATGNTAVNLFTMAIVAVPTTTTMLIACPVTGTNPVVTGASFLPVFVPQYGAYNLTNGPNCVAQYNPDNTGSPYIPGSGSVVPAPVWRTLLAASATSQIEFEGVAGQTIVIASGGAGTTRWSQYAR